LEPVPGIRPTLVLARHAATAADGVWILSSHGAATTSPTPAPAAIPPESSAPAAVQPTASEAEESGHGVQATKAAEHRKRRCPGQRERQVAGSLGSGSQVSGSQKQEQKQESGIGMSKMEGKQVVEEKGESSNKSLAKYKVVCYNCSESGHYSTKCPKPKLCLREEIMQLMDVRSGRNHNSQPSSLVVQVRGSEVTKEEIIRNLQKIFDKDWSWCIRELGEYSYSIRFPPDSKVESIVFGGTTYFYLDKEGVMVSLKAWSGEVQPVEELVDTWMVIIKVAVRDPTKIPRTRLMEMAKKIYLISFKVEGAEQVGGGNNPDNFDDDDLLGDDQGMEESDTNSKMDTDKSQTPSNTESKSKEDKGAGSSKNPAGSKTVSMWAGLFREIEKEVTAAEEHTL
ncbi:hypothetical protein EJB05_37042, partial [Eragrostis curvula]